MKKFKRLFIALAFLTSLACLAFGLAACDSSPKVTALRIENARISFMQGDEFETGDGFTVIAVYDDGTEKDVTSEATVRRENGMDMNVAGDYQITVSYGDKREIYTVYVNDSEDVLRKIELDTSAVKTSYELGDTLSLNGLILNLTYQNSRGVNFTEKTTSLKDFTVGIKTESGSGLTGDVFTALGTFDVTVSQGNVSASYKVNVDTVNLSTIRGALTAAWYFKGNVVSGDSVVKGQVSVHDLVETARYHFDYGNNYTRFTDSIPDPAETYHCSKDDEGIFIIQQSGDKIVTSNMNNPDMINGSPYLLWYLDDTVYGIEDTLLNLYDNAEVCTNDDLTVAIDESKKEYSFSFSGLKVRSTASAPDYFETTVSFTLNADYTIKTATFDQKYYEDNSAWAEGERTFETNPDTGKTVPLAARPSYYTIVTVTQETGERTLENKYTRDMFKISSYDLTFNGQVLEDGETLELDVATGDYRITIGNILPTTAVFEQDLMYFDYEGNRSGAGLMISNEHFTVFRNGMNISLTVRHGGDWVLLFKTEKLTRRIPIHVTGAQPSTMEAQLYNVASESFYAGDTKTLALNGTVYFFGKVDAYADDQQSVQLLSGNQSAVTLERAVIDGVSCFKFSASETGVYEVSVSSTATPSLNCKFTFTVSDAADLSALLTGSYTVEDTAGNIYLVTFSRSDEGELIKGTVNVKRTPTELNGTPIESEAVTQTLSFFVDGLEIVVEHGQDDKIWVEFTVDEENRLVLVDQRMLRYTLSRV